MADQPPYQPYRPEPGPTDPYAAPVTPPYPGPATDRYPVPVTYPAPVPVTYPVPVTVPYPAPVTVPYPAPEPVITQIGDITVTATTVFTPVGAMPLAGSRWNVTEGWTTEQKIPSWAITLAIVGFFCLTVFSLLFLLAKETVYRGSVGVHVASGPNQYSTWIPVAGRPQVQHVYAQVNYVRSLAGYPG